MTRLRDIHTNADFSALLSPNTECSHPESQMAEAMLAIHAAMIGTLVQHDIRRLGLQQKL